MATVCWIHFWPQLWGYWSNGRGLKKRTVRPGSPRGGCCVLVLSATAAASSMVRGMMRLTVNKRFRHALSRLDRFSLNDSFQRSIYLL
jgi:hypothetical protein